MRVLLIAAVLGILVQPALAFNKDHCSSLESYVDSRYEAAVKFREYAQTTDDQELFDKYFGWADESLERASHYANIYQAFCKD